MIHLLQNFADHCSQPNFFSFPTWYKYLEVRHSGITDKCEVNFDLMKGGKFNGADILLVGLSVIDILVRLTALVSVIFVVYGGLKYITSQGSPEGTGKAKDTILHALLGMAIAIVAAAFVSFVGNRIR